jgi:LEA14-like dessication related protein
VKKWILIIIVSLLIIAVGLAVYFYLFPKKAQHILIPDIDQVNQIRIRVDGDTARMNIGLRLENKGPFRMNIDSLIYHVRFDTATLLAGRQELGIVLASGDADTFQVPVNLPFKRLIASIMKVQEQDSVDIFTAVRVVYATVLGNRSLAHEKTSTIAVPIPPEFELEKMEYVRRDKHKFFFRAHLKMVNRGRIELNVYDLKYTMKAEDLFTATGIGPKFIKVMPHSVITEVLPITVDVNKILKTALKIISDNNKVRYRLKIHGYIQNKGLGEDRSEVEIKKEGVLELKK